MNYELAVSDLDRAIEISPFDHDGYFKRAIAFAGLNEMTYALNDLEQALKLDPNNLDYLHSRGLIQFVLEDFSSALADLNRMIAATEGQAQVDLRVSRLLIDRGRTYIGLSNEQKERTMPSDQIPILDRAVADGDNALKLLEESFSGPEWGSSRLGINLQLADAHFLLGEAYSRLERVPEAQLEYQKSDALR